jgi:photoactive yellow protein
MGSLPEFDTPELAKAIEQLTSAEIDQLPYGVIGLDPNGVVRVYSKTEAALSGHSDRLAQGKLFFIDVAPCMNTPYFKGKIDAARARGDLDIEFTFVGDFADRERELTVRVQSAQDGGSWIFHMRD